MKSCLYLYEDGERRDLTQAEVCIGYCMLVKPPLSSLSHDIFFEFDHWDLSDANRQILRDLSNVLKKEDRLKIELQGHCDERGDNNYNIALGQRRAESTKIYLIVRELIQTGFIQSLVAKKNHFVLTPMRSVGKRIAEFMLGF